MESENLKTVRKQTNVYIGFQLYVNKYINTHDGSMNVLHNINNFSGQLYLNKSISI